MDKISKLTKLKPKFYWKEWFKRYLEPELIGLFLAYSSILLYNHLSPTPSDVLSSFIATWAENLGYYSIIFFKDYKSIKSQNSKIRNIYLTLKGIVYEFGLAELLDSFVFRPFFIFWGIRLLGLEFGLIAGKLISDITFYVPAIIFYELKKIK